MNLSNLMKGKTTILPSSNQDTEGEIVVLNKQDIKGEIQIGFQSNSMYAKIDISKQHNFTQKGEIIVLDNQDIKGEIQVSFQSNSMYAKIDVLKQYNLTQQGEIVILNNKDIKGEIQVDFKLNSMYAKIGVLKEYNSTQQGEITVAIQDFRTQIYGELNIKGITNKSYGQVEVIPPPKEYAIFEAIQDTFIRSATPRVDYGYVPSMYVGDINNNDICRSLVYIDFSSLPSKMCITKATLSLMSVDINEEDINLQLYSVDKQWQENNVTWMSNVNTVDLLQEKTSKQGILYTEFDVTDYVNQCRKNIRNNNGFLIKAVDETNFKQKAFYTKESNNPPRLIIEYYDPTLRNVAKSSIYGETNVHIAGSNNVKCEISVLQTRNFADSDLYGEINIPNDRILGEIEVLYGKDSHGEINIYHKNQNDLECEINIPNDRVFGEVTIGNKHEIYGELFVSKISEIQGEISTYVSQDSDVHGELIAGFKNNVYGEINIKSIGIVKGELQVLNGGLESTKGELLTGELNISQGEIKIIGRDINDVCGELTVRIDGEDNEQGEFIVGFKSELNGEIDILQKSERKGEIIIGNKYLSDIDGELLLAINNELGGEINILQKSVRKGEIIIGNKYLSDIDGELLVPIINELDGEINVKEVKDLYGELTIANKFVNDVNGEFIVGEYEFDGYAFIM